MSFHIDIVGLWGLRGPGKVEVKGELEDKKTKIHNVADFGRPTRAESGTMMEIESVD
jgi:hypothetical protein